MRPDPFVRSELPSLRLYDPGDRLPNCATVIAFKPLPKGKAEAHSAIVLAICGGYHPYVTWLYNREGDYAVSGHYYDDLTEAVKDFEARR